ncbi:hypothetical protein E9531_11400 [Lampropedia puyangensis]|uniref:Uncharacterized protein n=1 Tax=Lampropedia puyangensis TaxID=1330072 RepID=A0A4S8EYB4_9BURK|nr:hypothetical protein [Lampropedia puyangensis]THT99929.1 hypothetical protein E9531_11400 [Lampropedia puyangensis]
MGDRVSAPPTFRLGYFALPAEDVEELRLWVESSQVAMPMRIEMVRKGPFSAIATDIGSMLVPQRVAQLSKIGCPVLLIAEHDPTGAVQASVRSSMPQAVVIPRPLRTDVLSVCLNALAPLTRAAPEVLLACVHALTPLVRVISEKHVGAAPEFVARSPAAVVAQRDQSEPPARAGEGAALAHQRPPVQEDDLRTTLMGRLPEALGLQTDMGNLPELGESSALSPAIAVDDDSLQEVFSQEALFATADLTERVEAPQAIEEEFEPVEATAPISVQQEWEAMEESVEASTAFAPAVLVLTDVVSDSQPSDPLSEDSPSEPVTRALESERPVLQGAESVASSTEVLTAQNLASAEVSVPRAHDTDAARRYQRLVRAVADWKDAGVKVDSMARYKLKGWPTEQWLQEDPLRVRVASLLASKPLMLNEVASATGASWVQCQACLSGLMAAGLLQRQSKSATLDVVRKTASK